MVALDAAQVLRQAWERNGSRLVDIKFECGINSVGDVVIGDTIDADCWRLWQNGNPDTPLDRQLFKNNCTRDEITDSYKIILAQTMKGLSVSGNTGN
jgi:phosphoribosylaminoimidazole-succinocarboxamide synthase